jgi:hypothetical protein
MFALPQDAWGAAEVTQYEMPFWERLKNRPLNIGGLIAEQPIQGANDVVTSFDIPEMGHVVTSKGSKADTEKITFWKTLLQPVWITSGNFTIDDDTRLSIQDGITDSQLLMAMSDRCSRRYDQLCMDALIAPIQLLSGKTIPWDEGCRIPYNTVTGGNPKVNVSNFDKISESQGAYLTPQKLNLATTIMANNGIPETARKVCILSSYQALMFRNNSEVKDTDYNIIPALRFDDLGQNGYGDVSGFIKTNLVPMNLDAGGENVNGGDNAGNILVRGKLEYAYVVAFDYLRAGYKAAWYPTISPKNNDKQIPYVTMSMHGCYGVTRIQDPAVIGIECLSLGAGKINFNVE